MATPSGGDPVRLTADAVRRIARSLGVTGRMSRENYNRSDSAGVAPGGVADRPAWPAIVTELMPLSTGELGQKLYKGRLLSLKYTGHVAAVGATPEVVAKVEWPREGSVQDIYIAPFPGQEFEVGQYGLATCVGEYAGRGIFTIGAAGDAGFYAKITGGSTSPYSFAEVDGPAVGAAVVPVADGGRASTADDKATEVLTALAGIPSGTIVWMEAGAQPRPWRFACVRRREVLSWQVNTGTPCTVTPLTFTDLYFSAKNLCARTV